jgi:hypothetical protein
MLALGFEGVRREIGETKYGHFILKDVIFMGTFLGWM